MENKIKLLITQLKEENSNRSKEMATGECSQYRHTALVHTYNNTLDIIKKLENLLK
jgi:hypothetical protein